MSDRVYTLSQENAERIAQLEKRMAALEKLQSGEGEETRKYHHEWCGDCSPLGDCKDCFDAMIPPSRYSKKPTPAASVGEDSEDKVIALALQERDELHKELERLREKIERIGNIINNWKNCKVFSDATYLDRISEIIAQEE